MAEYIEREAVLKIINDNSPHDKGGYNTEEEIGAGTACIYIRKAVENIPTADVVPKSEVEKLELTLQGVMWSVDKWLDETDYDADPIKRAITMREKTLKIVENLKAEVAREIIEKIESVMFDRFSNIMLGEDIRLCIAELKKKYTEGENNGSKQ